jgi:hypothetical protein
MAPGFVRPRADFDLMLTEVAYRAPPGALVDSMDIG